MPFDFQFDTPASLAPQALGLKTEDTELSTSLSLFPITHLNGCENLESTWSDDSPGMSESLLSLDFDSANELGSSALQSGSFSDPSPTLVTPTDPAHQTLFSPLSGDMFAPESRTGSCQDVSAPVSKRACLELDKTSMSFPGTMADFTLFPKEDEKRMPSATHSSSLNQHAQSADVLNLLNTLNAPMREANEQQLGDKQEPVMTASLPEISNIHKSPGVPTRGTRRRRRDADELLPIDAPIQPRTYHTESATSRRDSTGSKSRSTSPREAQDSPRTPSVLLENNPDMDARSLKRLSNTLAARRSRHRKAEELKKLYDTIEELRQEAAMWKKRCEDAERQRDQRWLSTPSM